MHVCVCVFGNIYFFLTFLPFGAAPQGLREISSTLRGLGVKAQASTLLPHEGDGGTITMTNLGKHGLTSFAAIIDPSQACVVAVGAACRKVLVVNGINFVFFVNLNVDLII